MDNTRVVSRFEVTVDGHAPNPISASPVGGDAFLAYAEVTESEGIPRESVYLETTYFVGEGMRAILRLRNHGSQPARGRLEIGLAADFADSEEAEQSTRRQSGDVDTVWDGSVPELRIAYLHPELDRAVSFGVERSPSPPGWTTSSSGSGPWSSGSTRGST